MIQLPDVTVVCITTKHYAESIHAIRKTLEQITPHSVLFFTDVPIQEEGIENVIVPKFDWEGYNRFLVCEIWRYVTTSHLLVCQWDGHVLDSAGWTDEFLQYDYIGAPWTYRDGSNVGNGGFSLRSKRLHTILAADEFINANNVFTPEDQVICRLYRKYLEQKYQIKFAPEELAHRFSYEMHAPRQRTFGFHNFFHPPYQEPIILKRDYAMGDIVMMEPIIDYYAKRNYRVILDVPHDCFSLFQNQEYPVMHIDQWRQQFGEPENIKTISLQMGYEVRPKQLALKSYYEMCGIQDGEIRNPRLKFPVDATTKMFDKYIVMHIDDTGMAHRNVHGVNWQFVIDDLESQGYRVFTIGNGVKKYGTWMNTRTKQMLMYLLAGADYFIGIDSGVAQVAVALNVKSVIFFGSVIPEYRYADLSNIDVIQNVCPLQKDGCYHSVVSEVGVECEVDKNLPPCITHTTESLITRLKTIIE